MTGSLPTRWHKPVIVELVSPATPRGSIDQHYLDLLNELDSESGESILPPEFSEDRLALVFARQHGAGLRYVAAWGKWLASAGAHWEIENTLAVFDLARKICRSAAAECNKTSEAKAIAKAKTVAAVETFARSDRRIAATVEQWDAAQSFFNAARETK